jgi:hypothetical protein
MAANEVASLEKEEEAKARLAITLSINEAQKQAGIISHRMRPPHTQIIEE